MIEYVYGYSNLEQAHRRALVRALDSCGLNGTCYFGYPVLTGPDGRLPLDALLVTESIGVVGFLFSTVLHNDVEFGDAVAEQDAVFVALETFLARHPSLRKNRKLVVSVDIVTLLPEALSQRPGASSPNEERLFCDMGKLPDVLSRRRLEVSLEIDIVTKLRAVIDRVVAIRTVKRREGVSRDDSMGAKLKRMEREIANLDRWQHQAAIATPNGAQRIRGLAGSGKTIVLALKAAYLHAQNPHWRIAVVFYTQSLYQQFKELIVRFSYDYLGEEPNWEYLQILHAWGSSYRTGFYYEIASALGIQSRSYANAAAQFGSKDPFDGCCSEVVALMQDMVMPEERKFDVVLVDEAQDMPKSFFRLVYHVCSVPKRIVWAYDELQQLDAAAVPSATELFGRDPHGEPLVSLTEAEGEAQRDVVLPVCYRNPPWILTLAHGLGFGTARAGGLVQHFDDPGLWTEIGYECEGSELKLGAPVSLRRRAGSYPQFFINELMAEDSMKISSFDDENEQFLWVAQDIHRHLTSEELEYTDFLIVLPNAYTAKSRGPRIVGALRQLNVAAHLVGVDNERDTVFAVNSIAVAHIYRAKGNEAPFVYVLDAEFATGSELSSELGLASRRNKLFTAITRSRAWVRICGVGERMKELEREFEAIRAEEFRLRFQIPTSAQLGSMKRLYRDRSKNEIAKISEQKSVLGEIVGKLARGEDVSSITEGLSRESLERALQRILSERE